MTFFPRVGRPYIDVYASEIPDSDRSDQISYRVKEDCSIPRCVKKCLAFSSEPEQLKSDPEFYMTVLLFSMEEMENLKNDCRVRSVWNLQRRDVIWLAQKTRELGVCLLEHVILKRLENRKILKFLIEESISCNEIRNPFEINEEASPLKLAYDTCNIIALEVFEEYRNSNLL